MTERTEKKTFMEKKLKTAEYEQALLSPQQPTAQHQKSVSIVCYWLPLFLYAGTIILVSSLSTPNIQFEAMTKTYLSVSVKFSQMNDKIVHLIEYGVLGFLTYRAIRYSWGTQLGQSSAFLTIIAVGLFGCIDEFHQWFIPLRNVEVLDLMADIIGGLIGISLWEWGRTLPTIRQLEEQLPFKLQVIRALATSKVKT